MESIEELKKELEKEKNKVSVLEQRLRLYELPSPVRAYYVGQKLLNQQVDYLNNFEFAEEIKKNPKEDKLYDRSMDVFEKLSGNASKLNSLRSDLSLSGDERKDISNLKFSISPESISNVLGNTAGQNH